MSQSTNQGGPVTESSRLSGYAPIRGLWHLFLIIEILMTACVVQPEQSQERPGEEDSLRLLTRRLEQLRVDYRIPGLSVVVLREQRVILAKGFGYADWENGISATAETPYNIASLTKPIAATVLMKLVETEKLELDSAMAQVLANRVIHAGNYVINGYAEGCEFIQWSALNGGNPYRYLYQDYRCDTERITVRHHLSHTAQGKPGARYRYNGMLYGVLSHVIEASSGESFPGLLVDYVIRPADMTSTIPSLSEAQRKRVLEARAKYYVGRGAGDFVPSNYPVSLSAAAGMVSTGLDLAKFDVALDENRLVSFDSKKAMFTPFVTSDGRMLPYGLGWFVQYHQGLELVWHYGLAPRAYSGLYLKVPSKRLTLILLANSEGLSADFQLGRGNVLRSPFAASFLKSIVNVTE